VDTPQGDLDGDGVVERTLTASVHTVSFDHESRKITVAGNSDFEWGCFGTPTTTKRDAEFCIGIEVGDFVQVSGTLDDGTRNNDGWFVVEYVHDCQAQGSDQGCDSDTYIIVEDHRGQTATSIGATTHRFHGETGLDTLTDETGAAGRSVTLTMMGHPVQWSNQLESEYYPHDAQEDEAHFYQECSNKGFCDRSSGECECLDGYEGVACERMSCPEGCSGHGTCKSLASMVHSGNPYSLWDGTPFNPKTYGCVCDPRWSGADCSGRVCPSGDDPVTTGQIDEVQLVELDAATAVDGTFSLYFTDEYGEVWRTGEILARKYLSVTESNCVFSFIGRTVTCDGASFTSDGFEDVDWITIAGTAAGTAQYPSNANDGEYKVFDPMKNNSRTESVGQDEIVFVEGVAFVDFDESQDSTWASYGTGNEGDLNTNDHAITLTRTNGLQTALLNIPNDVIEDIEVSADENGEGISYEVTFTANPGDLPEMICENENLAGHVHSFDADNFVDHTAATSMDIKFSSPNTIESTDLDNVNFLNLAGSAVTAGTLMGSRFRDSDHVLVTGSRHNDGVYEIERNALAVTNASFTVMQSVNDEAEGNDNIVIYKLQCQVRSELFRVGGYDEVNYDCNDIYVDKVDEASGYSSAHTEFHISSTGCDLNVFNIGDQLTMECVDCSNKDVTVTVTNEATSSGSLTVLPSGDCAHNADCSLPVEEGASGAGNGIPNPFFITKYGHGTKELETCSGRGLCDGSSGVCQCFKGYTLDDCSAQNALAM
jgi:hypothetical protein